MFDTGCTKFSGSAVKSEYMKRYQEPSWDEYGPCYRALRHYRLSRRLREQAHEPWPSDDWGPARASDDSAAASSSSSSSSSSSGAGGHAPQCARASPPPPPAELAAREGPEQRERRAREEQGAEAAEEPALPALPVKDVKEKRLRTKETVRLPSSTKPRLRPSALLARRSRKAAKNPQRSSSKIRENKHPFALYGWGEKQTDTGSQKTHNVCASAPVHEIHESALRARNRRQVEKRRLVAQRQGAHSADVEKARRVPPPSPDNPWMTEYMRCYSARA